jgi:MFS transporter, OPA family, glycerol-3-phosphate transporter
MSTPVETKLEWRESHQHPPGFRARRGINWFTVGLMYAMYYMCRYNFRFAAPGMREEFGFSITQISDIWVWFSVAYGTGQLVNGLFCDRIGGKASMLIGAVGTIIVNLVFGFGSFAGNFATFCGVVAVERLHPGRRHPRHGQDQRRLVQPRGARCLLGHLRFHDPVRDRSRSTSWPRCCWPGSPSVCSWLNPGTGACCSSCRRCSSPSSRCCWPFLRRVPGRGRLCRTPFYDDVDNSSGTRVPVKEAFKFVFSNPVVWFYAVAYGTTGAVRHSFDQLIALFFEDVMGFNMKHKPAGRGRQHPGDHPARGRGRLGVVRLGFRPLFPRPPLSRRDDALFRRGRGAGPRVAHAGAQHHRPHHRRHSAGLPVPASSSPS